MWYFEDHPMFSSGVKRGLQEAIEDILEVKGFKEDLTFFLNFQILMKSFSFDIPELRKIKELVKREENKEILYKKFASFIEKRLAVKALKEERIEFVLYTLMLRKFKNIDQKAICKLLKKLSVNQLKKAVELALEAPNYNKFLKGLEDLAN